MITHKKTSAFFAENHAFSFHSGPFNLLLLSQFLRYRSQYCLLCTLRAPANCLFLQMSFRCKMHVVYWESHVFFRFSVIATNVNFTDAYGITKTIFRKKQNIGLLWAKVRMFCIESTDVCLKEVRCFCFPERTLLNIRHNQSALADAPSRVSLFVDGAAVWTFSKRMQRSTTCPAYIGGSVVTEMAVQCKSPVEQQ